MRFRTGLKQFLAVATFALIAIGCDPATGSNVNHEDDPDFVRGKNRLARKDIAGSILSFEKAIANNPANDLAHFELALILKVCLVTLLIDCFVSQFSFLVQLYTV